VASASHRRPILATDQPCSYAAGGCCYLAVPPPGQGHRPRLHQPRTPRLNGKVERSHRIDAEEFYRLLDGVVIDDAKILNTESSSVESLETPSVLRTLGVGQDVMVAVTASRRCCAARVVTRSVGSGSPFTPANQPHRQCPQDVSVCSQSRPLVRFCWFLTVTSCSTSVTGRSSSTALTSARRRG
jgi:hypothetical protein